MSTLESWTVYNSPIDHHGQFVARKFLMNWPTQKLVTAPTLDGVRSQLPAGLFRMERDIQDHPTIVERWL